MRYEIFTALDHPYQAMRDAAYLCVLDQEDKRDNQANWMHLQQVRLVDYSLFTCVLS